MMEFVVLARASANAGVDVWHYSNQSTGYGNLRNSLAWMAPYCANGAECGNASNFSTPQDQAKCIGWPYPAVDYSPISECKIIFGLAAIAYKNKTYAAAAAAAAPLDTPYDWWYGGIGISELMTSLYVPTVR